MAFATDGLVGKLALQKGMISAVQLKECLAEQGALHKSGQKRPLGVIMVSRGLMKDEDLLDLLEEQRRVLAERSNYTQVRKEDFLFGQILLKQNVATSEEINQALRIQAEAAERGEMTVPRLGQILIDMGVTEEKEIQKTLKLQYKTLYECPGCTLKYNLVEASGDKQYRCKKCDAILVPKPPGTGVKADESAYGMKLEVASDLPPEVAQAELDPTNLFDRYILVRQLGRGGSGTVHLAYQRELKRFVALKMLRNEDAETMARFAHEAQVAARLRHPNIVSVYEIGKHLNVSFIALEFVDGRSLDQRERLPLRKACQLVRDVAGAVHAAHEKGIIHRDLKPQNILLDHNDRPYVTDFGLAREVSSAKNLTLDGIVVGTPAYMSSEQAQGDRTLDARSDVASLGAVFYELLTGVQPYTGNTQIDVALAVINTDPTPPRRVNPEVPPPLEAVCLKAMAKRREDRYETARGFAEDLQRYLEGEPVQAQRPGVMSTTVRRLSKNKTANALLAAAALLVILAIGIVTTVLGQSRVKDDLLQARTLEDTGHLQDALRIYEGIPGAGAEAERVRSALQAKQTDERRREDHGRARTILGGAGPETPPERRLEIAAEALAVAPDFEPAYLVRAQAHQELGDDGAAYEDLGRAAKVSANPLPHFQSRAEIARNLGRVENEIDDLTAALTLSALSVDLRVQRAGAYARQARKLLDLRSPEARARAERIAAKADADLVGIKKHPLLEGVQAAMKEVRERLKRGS